MKRDSSTRSLKVALLVGAILAAIAYAFIFWNPAGDRIDSESQTIPAPAAAPR